MVVGSCFDGETRAVTGKFRTRDAYGPGVMASVCKRRSGTDGFEDRSPKDCEASGRVCLWKHCLSDGAGSLHLPQAEIEVSGSLQHPFKGFPGSSLDGIGVP